MTTIPLPDLAATQALAARIAARLRPGDVLALEGTLGVGKTTLARELLRALGHEGEVPSPSFTIIETYDPPGVRLPVVHADFYRLEDPAEAEEIGLDDYRQGAVLLAEWPDHAGVSGMSAIASRCVWKSRKTGGRPLSCPARDG
jgi:tRNA threonylcarbamoyladenosine biosynthesis protein TsaE